MPEVKSVALCDDALAAIVHPALQIADVVVVDPAITGADELIDAARSLGVAVLVCREDRRVAIARKLIDKCQGHLLKAHLAKTGLLWSAIVAVAGGAQIIGPGLQVLPLIGVSVAPTAVLTDREATVLKLVADGKTTKEIACEIAYSDRTVKTILHDIVTKLNVTNRSAAVARALREGHIA